MRKKKGAREEKKRKQGKEKEKKKRGKKGGKELVEKCEFFG